MEQGNQKLKLEVAELQVAKVYVSSATEACGSSGKIAGVSGSWHRREDPRAAKTSQPFAKPALGSSRAVAAPKGEYVLPEPILDGSRRLQALLNSQDKKSEKN